MYNVSSYVSDETLSTLNMNDLAEWLYEELGAYGIKVDLVSDEISYIETMQKSGYYNIVIDNELLVEISKQ